MATAAALSLTGLLALWHLAAVALVGGLAAGLYYPAYSALVPSLVPARDLLAVNGLEGVVRPMLAQAGGPPSPVSWWRRCRRAWPWWRRPQRRWARPCAWRPCR